MATPAGADAAPTAQPTVATTILPEGAFRFAVISDYGSGGEGEPAVATLVKSWKPDFVLTTGDNNYPAGSGDTIDDHIGKYYHRFIAPYRGKYGVGASENLFFPALGNHDWEVPGAEPYVNYFSLPGNGRYYDIQKGPVHLFILDSDPHEPDGTDADSAQADWLRAAVDASHACWKLATMHHPPFSSGVHGSSAWMQWPFHSWGLDAVLAGHDHMYEHVTHDDIPYLVSGLGGAGRYPMNKAAIPGSKLRYNANYGALLVTVNGDDLTFQFINVANEVIDTTTIHKDCA
ncbi:MAG: hypothetical protein NVSMB42_00840 [Herpetosiphon sp.]